MLVGPALFLPSRRVDADQQMVFEGNATPVTEYSVQLTAGVRVTWETRQLSANGDPVLHLFNGDGEEVSVNNDGAGGGAARLIYTPDTGGTYRLLVRARNGSRAGTCVIYQNGAAMRPAAQYGGWFVLLPDVRAKEDVTTAILPRTGDTYRHLSSHGLYLIGNNGVSIEKRALSSSHGMGPTLTFRSGSEDSSVMVAKVLFGGSLSPAPPDTTWAMPNDPGGPVRLMRNDAALPGHDPDKDGLGTELEQALGTCPRRLTRDHRASYNCAVEPRDTDGDGISDGWEVLGRTYDPAAFSQPLPVWGANPRHKDLFVEVDFMRRTKEENVKKAIDHMTPDAARYYARAYGDAFTTDSVQRLRNALAVRNPDGQPGISVHLDIGVMPKASEDVTVYGDWGGFNAADAIKGGEGDNEAPDGTYWKGVKASDAWKTNMRPARRGIFRYALSYGGGNGQNGEGLAASYGFHSGPNAAHETGHTMGLGHSAPTSKPWEARVVNCKPNYISLMNYAYYDDPTIGFSNAEPGAVPALNNARLVEWRAVRDPTNPAAVRFMDVLQNKYSYWVDRTNGHVDWNRDGEFAQQGTTVKAYANYQPRGDCEHTRHNEVEVTGPAVISGSLVTLTAKTTQPPALARIGQRLYAFWISERRLWYAYSDSKWNCPRMAETGCNGARWQAIYDADMQADGGVDVERIRVRSGAGSVEQLLLITIDGRGRVWERRIHGPSGAYRWSRRQAVPNSVGIGAPSLAATGDGSTIYLVYKNPVHKVMQNRLVTYIGWEGEKYVRVEDGSASGGNLNHHPHASPGIFNTYLSSESGVKALYGVFAPFTYDESNGVPAIFAFEESTGKWTKTNLIDDWGADPIYGRPAMAWLPYRRQTEYPGRFYLVYVQRTKDDKPGPLAMLVSYVQVSDRRGQLAKAERVGLIAAFDNAWLLSYGVDLIYEPGVDTNLRALYASAIEEGNHTKLYFRPKADGINDYDYINYNDWATLRIGLCKYVVNPAGNIPNPIRCS